MTTTLDNLKSLHTSIVDTLHGYEGALKQEPQSELAPVFRRMSALHLSASDELSKLLAGMGEPVDADGSFMSTVHRAVIDLRSMVTGLGHAVLPSFASGEERNLKAYETALETNADDSRLMSALEAQRERLQAAVAEIRRLESVA